MNKLVFAFFAFAVVAGCDDSAKSSVKGQVNAPAVVKSDETAAVAKGLKLPDGTELSLSGSVLKQTSKQNETGKLNRNEVAFDTSGRKAEAEVYAELEKSGYSRKVVEEREGFLKVHYYKENFPVVGGTYQDKESNGQEKSRLSLYWQES